MKKDNEDDLRAYIKAKMEVANGQLSDQYNQAVHDFRFADGEQWGEEERQARQVGASKRPMVVINLTRRYIDRIVNPLRQNPIGIQVDGSSDEVTEYLNDFIRNIEYESDASEAYETAFEDAVTAGFGFVLVTTDYDKKEGLEQKICIQRVFDPTKVYIDPSHRKIDGSDAEWGFFIDTIDKDTAKDMYGDDLQGLEIPFGADIYSSWTLPSDEYYTLTFYRKRKRQKVRYFYQDGSSSIEKIKGYDDFIVGERKEWVNSVQITEFCGYKIVNETELPIEYIPIIPVYGDRLRLDQDNLKWGGVVHWVQDQQRLYNYYRSNENELVQLAPISPWIAESRQIEGYEDEWKRANTHPFDTLPYNAVSENGTPLPPPQRTNNIAQTAHLIQSAESIKQEIGASLGMFDNVFGELQGANQSGASVLLNQNAGENSTAQYMNNLAKSIKQVGRVVLSLIPIVYDTEREIRFRSESGEKWVENINISQVLSDLSKFDITTHAGPTFESQRRESQQYLTEIANMVGAGMNLPILYEMVKNSKILNKKRMVEVMDKMLPAEFREVGENAPDPEAMQALQTAQQTIEEQAKMIDQMEGIIQQLQSAVIDNEADRDARIQAELIKSQTALAKASMDNETKLAQEELKQTGETTRDIMEIQAENDRQIQETAKKAIETTANITKNLGSENFVPLAKGKVNYFNKETEIPNTEEP